MMSLSKISGDGYGDGNDDALLAESLLVESAEEKSSLRASQRNKNWCPVPGILLNTSFFALDKQSLLKAEAKKVVIKTKPVGRVKAEDALNVAYQNDISSVKERVDDELAGMLQHNEGLYEEFDPFELRLIVNDYGEGKYGANDKEDPTDENEISEEELLDENETSDEKESMDEYESSDGEELMNDYETSDED